LGFAQWLLAVKRQTDCLLIQLQRALTDRLYL